MPTLWVVLIIVLIIFVMIFAVSVPGQMRKQKAANENAEQAYRDGWQRALDVHHVPAAGEAGDRASAWIVSNGKHGSWVGGVNEMKLAPIWEQAYRDALQAHGAFVDDSDLAQIQNNPYTGR